MPLLLVRHAHAVSRSEWDGDDMLRPLSKKGSAQSRRLVGSLVEYKPTRLVSSPYMRCVDTLEPLATSTGLTVEIEDALAEGSEDAAVKLVRSMAGQDVALCSHGDVIPFLLAALNREYRLGLGANPRDEKASVWVFEARDGRFTRATYHRPPRS